MWNSLLYAFHVNMERVLAVPVIIVSGFLGCGKTTFLRHLLPMCGELGIRPALIINEVGDVDVDGQLLADLHAEQVRLIGGCVCCTLQSQLTSTVYDVLERKSMDLIIIECSGLSNPMDVVNALSAPAMIKDITVSHIICLLDAGRAERVLITELAKAQVQSANVLILNKADAVSADDRLKIENTVGEFSPHAIKHWAAYGDIGSENMQAILTSNAPSHCSCGCGHDHSHEHSHSLPASFCTVALALPELIKRKELESILSMLPESVVRVKGFANIESQGWHVLHRVFDSINISALPGNAPNAGAVLVCIGQHICADEINSIVNNALGVTASESM